MNRVLAETPPPVHVPQALVDGVVCACLPKRINSGRDFQPAIQHRLPPIFFVQILANFLHHIRRDLFFLRVLPSQPYGALDQRFSVGFFQIMFRGHAPQHMITTHFRGGSRFGIGVVGVVPIGILDKPGEHRGFFWKQLGGAFPKVVLGRGLDAVASATEINLVGIHLQNLLFRIGLFQFGGQDDLFQFAVQLLLSLGRDRAHQLHGECAGTFPSLAARLHEIPGSPHEAFRVHAAMLQKTRIFRGDDAADESPRNISVRNDHAMLFGKNANDVAIAVQYLGDGLRNPDREVCEITVCFTGINGPQSGEEQAPAHRERNGSPQQKAHEPAPFGTPAQECLKLLCGWCRHPIRVPVC